MQLIRLFRSEALVPLLCMMATQALGELPTARMTAIFPMGCRIGAEAELQVHGSDLDGARGLLFSDPGISAEVTNAGERKFKVQVAGGVPAGVYEVRFDGALGLTNPRPFVVSSLAEVRSPAGNTTRETAAAIGNNSVVNGIAVSRQSVWFKVTATRGQRLLLRVSAAALDSRLNPVMLLRDGAGERLARGSDAGLID